MEKPKSVSLDEVHKEDLAICPNCGVLFVKKVKGEERSFWTDTVGVYCPVCETLVVKKTEKGKG